MAGNFQGQFSSNLSFDNPFCVLYTGENDVEESKKDDEDANDKDVIVIEERVMSGPSEQEYISLEELADSDFIRSRQAAAKSIVEHLHQAGTNKEALHSVISVMCKLSEDEDIMVRSELIEQIPSIALFCKEHSEHLGVVIRQQIVPYTVKLLTDIQRQIRKTGHSILIDLLENNVIDHSQLSEWICPLIAQLVTSENIPEGLRLEDVSVMCKMIPYVGKEMTEKFFLEPFLSICRDSTSSAREVCMLNFGTISQVVGRETTEKTLLSTFLDLCHESWNVKTKCVDIAIDLATAVSPSTRNEILAPVYLNFLKDYSVAVSQMAYLSLGRFIATFAEPSETRLTFTAGMWDDEDTENDTTDDTLLSAQNNQGQCFESLTSGLISKPKFLEECSFENLNNTLDYDSDDFFSNQPSSNFSNCTLQFENSEIYESSICSSSETFCDNLYSNFSNSVKINDNNLKLSNITNSQSSEIKCTENSSLNTLSKEKHKCLQVDNENVFNNFQFWRMPLPEVDIEPSSVRTDLEKENSDACSVESTSTQLQNQNLQEPNILQDTDDCKLIKEDRYSPELNLESLSVQFSKKKLNRNIKVFFNDSKMNKIIIREKPDNQASIKGKLMTDTEKMVYDQDVVPPELLMEFINEATMNDNEMKMKNLAFYFPAVACTLGRKHWPCIRELFNTIAGMSLFNIRKTVASSLHELAIIVGPEITTEDLLPVFLKMLKDVSVRYTSSLMKNMSIFLKLTKPGPRRQFLNLVEELCSWEEDDRNWRYRLTISEQLTLCVELFSSHEALRFLPVSLLILQDKVSAVRRSGVKLLAVIIKSISTNPKSSIFLKATLSALDQKYRKSNKWLWRQLYVFLCQDLAENMSLPAEQFVEEIVPNLLSLTWDAVPNVRLAVARCLALTLFPLDYLPSMEKMHFTLLLQALYSLQSDVDKDVRHFGQMCVSASNIFKSNILTPEEESDASHIKTPEE